MGEEDHWPMTGLVLTGELLGEKPETTISLPIISNDEHTCSPSPTAIPSWNSIVHNSSGLNKVTRYNDRVYRHFESGSAVGEPSEYGGVSL